MKPALYIFSILLLWSLAGCRKDSDEAGASVFVRLFATDTSYLTGGAIQLADENFFVYGFTPEDNEHPPLIIKCDAQGHILWKKHLPADFHYCTIQVIAEKKLMAVGVVSSLSTAINVCEINSDSGNIIDGTLRAYVVNEIKAGPLLRPKFEKNSTGDLTIAGTASVADTLIPFILHINPTGIADPMQLFNFNLPGVTSLMTKGLVANENGFTISGSTYNTDMPDTTRLVTFCLRLNTSYQELWRTVVTLPGESVTVTSLIENESSVILTGAVKTGSYTNTAINDMVGTLYTQQLDLSGNLMEELRYVNYKNLAHAGELLSTADGGYIMAATSNELSDIHLISDSHVYLLKLDEHLQELWHREFDGFNAFTAVSVVQASDGGFLIGGYEHSGTYLYNMCLIKTDINGEIVMQ